MTKITDFSRHPDDHWYEEGQHRFRAQDAVGEVIVAVSIDHWDEVKKRHGDDIAAAATEIVAGISDATVGMTVDGQRYLLLP